MSYTVVANTDINSRSLAALGGKNQATCQAECDARQNCVGAILYGDGRCWPVWGEDGKYGRGGSTFLRKNPATTDPAGGDNLSNYIKMNNTVSSGGDLSRHKWTSPNDLAYICNQQDDCDHIIVRKDNGAPVNGVSGGGWLRNAQPLWSHGDYVTYKKKARVNKVTDAKNDPSILANPATRVKTYDGGNYDATEWPFPKGYYPRDSSLGNANDRIASMKVPLGYRVLFQQHFLHDDPGGKEGAGNGPGIINGPIGLDSAKLASWGTLDGISSMIVEQVPFDVGARFLDMTSPPNNIDPADARLLRYNWCNSEANIDDVKCTNFFSDPSNGYSYDATKFSICKNKADWYNSTSCRSVFNNAVKGSNESNRQQAKDKIRAYCDGPGVDQEVCGCYNVTKFGDACLRDPNLKGKPGCKQLNASFSDLPSSANITIVDKFCSSDECITRAVAGSSVLLPDFTQGKNCPNITACIQDFRQANLTGASVDASCKNTVT